ncbi:MAG: hypothetical protein HOJ79_12160 [Nitrospina sp.]|nr:hypothetical protein [Nitrospina sp.]
MVSDGTGKPYKYRFRPPSFTMTGAMGEMCQGGMLADIVLIFL